MRQKDVNKNDGNDNISPTAEYNIAYSRHDPYKGGGGIESSKAMQAIERARKAAGIQALCLPRPLLDDLFLNQGARVWRGK